MPPSIDEVVNSVEELVSLPSIFTRINEMVEDPKISITQVGDVVGQDPGLTARLLRMANSAMYGLSAEVDTVSKAVSVIGLQRLRDLVLATSAVEAFEGIPNELMTMDNYWKHSIYCGLIAKFLAEEINLDRSNSMFVAGLLHDIGHLAMFKCTPDLSRQALLKHLEGSDEPELHSAEQKVIGFDHAMVGGKLAADWHLPVVLVETIRYHHEPEKAEKYPKHTAIIHIANSIAVLVELNTTKFSETDAPKIHEQAWETTGLDKTIIESAIEAAQQQFNDMHSILLQR